MRLVVLTLVLAAGVSKPAVDVRALGDALEAAAHLAEPTAGSAALHFKAAKARDHHIARAVAKPKFLLPTTPTPPTVKIAEVGNAVSPLLSHNAANVDFSDSDLTDLADEISNISNKRSNVSSPSSTNTSAPSPHVAVNGTAPTEAHSEKRGDEIQQLTAELVADAAAAKGSHPSSPSVAKTASTTQAAPVISKRAVASTAGEDPQRTIDKALEYFAAPHSAGQAHLAVGSGHSVNTHGKVATKAAVSAPAKAAVSAPAKAAVSAPAKAAVSAPAKAAVSAPAKAAVSAPAKAAVSAPAKAAVSAPAQAAASAPAKAAANVPPKGAATTPAMAGVRNNANAAASAPAKVAGTTAAKAAAKTPAQTAVKATSTVTGDKALAHVNSTHSPGAQPSDAAAAVHVPQFAEPATRQVLERNDRTQLEKVGDALRGIMEHNPLEIEPPQIKSEVTDAGKNVASVDDQPRHKEEEPTGWFSEVRSAMSSFFR